MVEKKLTREPVEACLNCGGRLAGPYCAQCGQNNRQRRLRFLDLARNAFSYLFDFDSVIFRTIFGLTLRPGKTCQEYVEGKRVKYINPVKYFLVVSTMYLLVDSNLGPAAVVESAPTLVQSQAMVDFDQLVAFTINHLNIFLLLGLPALALLLKVIFRKATHNVTELLVFFLFVEGHIYLLTLPLLVANSLSPHAEFFSALRFLVNLIFFPWALISFFQWPKFKGVFLSLAVMLLHLFVVIALAILFSVLFVLGWYLWNM